GSRTPAGPAGLGEGVGKLVVTVIVAVIIELDVVEVVPFQRLVDRGDAVGVGGEGIIDVQVPVVAEGGDFGACGTADLDLAGKGVLVLENASGQEDVVIRNGRNHVPGGIRHPEGTVIGRKLPGGHIRKHPAVGIDIAVLVK